jgi:hypothetical protein
VNYSLPSGIEPKAKLVLFASHCPRNSLCNLARKDSHEIVKVFLSFSFDEQVDVIAVEGIIIDFYFKPDGGFKKQMRNESFIVFKS